jgi:hypothetical protein
MDVIIAHIMYQMKLTIIFDSTADSEIVWIEHSNNMIMRSWHWHN